MPAVPDGCPGAVRGAAAGRGCGLSAFAAAFASLPKNGCLDSREYAHGGLLIQVRGSARYCGAKATAIAGAMR
jgi:hypothetical protein